VAGSSRISILSAGIIFIKKIFKNPYKSIGLSKASIINLKLKAPGRIRNLRITGGQVTYSSPLELTHALKEIFAEGIYEQAFPQNPYIIDCGANIGMSVIYLKNIAPDALIDAFEPDERNFSLLKKNVQSFDLKDVFLHNAAVWKEDTELNFSAEGTMSSRISNAGAEGKGSIVKAVRLRNYLTRKVDFLKIDIEGAEFEVLKDSADMLYLVKHMFIEYHGTFEQNGELLSMLEIITNQGFSFYIKEAAPVYEKPFTGRRPFPGNWDVQLNIFCIKR